MMATLLTNGKVQRATHNIMAYRIAVPAKGTFLQVDLSPSLSEASHMCSAHCLII